MLAVCSEEEGGRGGGVGGVNGNLWLPGHARQVSRVSLSHPKPSQPLPAHVILKLASPSPRHTETSKLFLQRADAKSRRTRPNN